MEYSIPLLLTLFNCECDWLIITQNLLNSYYFDIDIFYLV